MDNNSFQLINNLQILLKYIKVCLNYVNNFKLMILVHDVVAFNKRYKIKLTNSTCILNSKLHWQLLYNSGKRFEMRYPKKINTVYQGQVSNIQIKILHEMLIKWKVRGCAGVEEISLIELSFF